MGPQTAAWVREHALPAAIRRELMAVCACSYGPTGHCAADRHGDCPGHTIASPEGWITDRSSVVVGPAVYLADRVCTWRCPCPCHTARPPPSPSARR
nr:DUF6248 family natural product biosynthesis protein [Streptomonospora nanhaiensis]